MEFHSHGNTTRHTVNVVELDQVEEKIVRLEQAVEQSRIQTGNEDLELAN